MFFHHILKAVIGLITYVYLGVIIAAADPSTISMVDVTDDVGIGSEHYGSPTRHSLGVVWVDVNDDGYPDIFATNGYDDGDGRNLRPHLYMNDGNGGFSLADNLLPDLENYEYVGAVAADYDRDGDMDVFIYTAHEEWVTRDVEGNPFNGPPNVLLKNLFVENGRVIQNSMFVDVAAQVGLDGCTSRFENLLNQTESAPKYPCRQTRSAAFLDYNLDGWIDIYLAQMVINNVSSSDPNLDFVGKSANRDVLFLNQGNGRFVARPNVITAGEATERSALAARSSHLNQDIWPDMYIGNVGAYEVALEGDTKDTILINDGNGNLNVDHEYIGQDTPAAMGISFGDINNDLFFDIYITDVPGHGFNEGDPNRFGNTLYVSHERGFSQNVAPLFDVEFTLSWGTNFADFNSDTDLDLFVGSGSRGQESMIFSNLNSLGDTSSYVLDTSNVRGSALADYDRDGDVDLLVVNIDGSLQLFENRSDMSINKSLVLNFEAKDSNLDAIGLRAVVFLSNGKTLMQQISGGSSFHSQDETQLVFGVGEHDVDKINIYWPHINTPVQKIFNVTSNNLTITEP